MVRHTDAAADDWSRGSVEGMWRSGEPDDGDSLGAAELTRAEPQAGTTPQGT
jgi:hypothetical protein